MDSVTVKDIIDNKGSQVWTVAPDATAFRALEIMADKNVGALLVAEPDGKPVGIFSERDYARKVVLRGKASKDLQVKELMTREVLVVTPDNTLDDCMALFARKRVRHLPVVKDDALCGVISIGDVVNRIISEQRMALLDLEKFITGAGYGG